MFTANYIYIYFKVLLLMANFIYSFKLYTFKISWNEIFKMNRALKFLSEGNLTVFTTEFHILVPLPNLTEIQSLSNNLDHVCHLVSPFSLPTLFFDGSALHIDLVCQRIVTRSVGSSAAVGTGNLVAGNVVCLVAAGGFGPGGIGNSSVLVAVCLPIECMGVFCWGC